MKPSPVDDRPHSERNREQVLEAELRSVRAQMEWMTSRKAWRMIQFADRIIFRLRHLSPVARLRAWAGAVKRVPRRLASGRAASWTKEQLRRAKHIGHTTRDDNSAAAPRGGASIQPPEDICSEYDLICLPVIAWRSRFQRPQQLMRQFAGQGHRVFYAALDFHAGEGARLSPLEENVWETALPGAVGGSVYRRLPSRDEVRRMAEAVDRLRRERGIAAAAIVVQLPFWTALAEELRRRFGWPIVYDCMDDHSGFSTNCAAMLRMERRLIAEADLAVVTSAALEAKIRPQARRTVLVRNGCDYGHFGNSSPLPMGEGPGVRAEWDGENAKCKLQTTNSKSQIPNQQILGSAAGPHPNPLPKGEGTSGPHPNPLPKGEGTSDTHPNPLPKGEGTGYAVPAAAKRPTIGFYGAIAEWFDADLVADLAELRPEWRFELIGSTYTGDVSRLERLPNVSLLGEKPYADLPALTAGWDAFIIPFKRIPLTEATNPVKVYEMLATGKPVAAVDLPELRPMAREGLLSAADDARGFAAAIERELDGDCAERRQLRRAFAAENTWRRRAEALDREIRELFPRASIVVVTYNNLHLNQDCLESIYRRTDWPNYEVIVVDNASSDGTPEWLAEEQRRRPDMRVILNADNRGFSAANNQGMRIARGEFICLLNNDTVVSRGWLSTLIGHLRAMPEVGIIGPVSNQVGNEAKVAVDYQSPADMPAWAAEYCRRHDGETFPIPMLGFFCVVFQRDLYQRVGELDERFGIGCFEDDDYCRRARDQGYELRCARDAFVHHWLEASFRLLGKQRYLSVFHENKQRYEAKWTAGETVGAG